MPCVTPWLRFTASSTTQSTRMNRYRRRTLESSKPKNEHVIGGGGQSTAGYSRDAVILDKQTVDALPDEWQWENGGLCLFGGFWAFGLHACSPYATWMSRDALFHGSSNWWTIVLSRLVIEGEVLQSDFDHWQTTSWLFFNWLRYRWGSIVCVSCFHKFHFFWRLWRARCQRSWFWNRPWLVQFHD